MTNETKCFCGKDHQPVAAYGAWCCPDALSRNAPEHTCRYCFERVGTKGAVHSRCERDADRLIDEDES